MKSEQCMEIEYIGLGDVMQKCEERKARSELGHLTCLAPKFF